MVLQCRTCNFVFWRQAKELCPSCNSTETVIILDLRPKTERTDKVEPLIALMAKE